MTISCGNNDSVDVVLPFYAPDPLLRLEQAIASVVNQEFAARSLIVVVNGGSADLRQKVCAAIAMLVSPDSLTSLRLISIEQVGIVSALNVGISASNAEWIARLDADDWMEPSRLRLKHEYLSDCLNHGLPVPDVIGSAVLVHDRRNPAESPWVMRKPQSDHAIRRYLLRGNAFAHPSVMIRRSLLLDVGGYRSIKAAEDLDLWLRLLRRKGVTFANLPQPLTHYSLEIGSLSHDRDSFFWSAVCRMRHVTSPGRFLAYSPKILADLVRYLIAFFKHG